MTALDTGEFVVADLLRAPPAPTDPIVAPAPAPAPSPAPTARRIAPTLGRGLHLAERRLAGLAVAARQRAVRGWLAATLVYVTAVFHRSSLGVAGIDATERFGISAGALSVFVLLQLGVYALMQVPTGLLVDRYGPRRLLLSAAAIMAVAQLLFAFSPSYPTALAARALLGAGDALTFVSILRFATNHFSVRRYPFIVSLTGTLGAVGNVVATVPLSNALAQIGWTPSFLIASLTSVGAIAVVWFAVPCPPAAPMERAAIRPPAELRDAARRVGERVTIAWRTPGTRAGFWVHFATMSFTAMFGVLWGMPYLVAQGFSRSQASAMLTVAVIAGIVASPTVGASFSRRPAARVPFALGVAFGTVGMWVALLAGFADGPPRWLLLVAIAVTAVGGPASGIGFSLARDYNRPDLAGTASGLVNVGGFSATILEALIVGRLLDHAGAEDIGAFRVAFAAALVVQLVGAVFAARWYLRLRSHVLSAQSRGEVVPVPVIRRAWDLATPR